jgi:hypothetical protein
MLELFHSKNAQSLGTWLAILTALFAGAGKLIPEWFGLLTWPQLVLVAFGAALATLFLLAVIAFLIGAGGALFRRYKPLSGDVIEPVARTYDDTDLRNKVDSSTEVLAAFARDAKAIDQRLGALEKVKGAIVDDYQRMNGVEMRLTEKIDALKGHVAGEVKKLEDRFSIIERNVTEDRYEGGKLFGAVMLGLRAMLARELAGKFAACIRAEGAFLTSKIDQGKALSEQDWEDWQSHHLTFESAMEHWLDLARAWHPKVDQWVSNIDPRELKGERWIGIDRLIKEVDDQTDYKMFVLRFERWRQFESTIKNILHVHAFNTEHADRILEEVYRSGSKLEGI